MQLESISAVILITWCDCYFIHLQALSDHSVDGKFEKASNEQDSLDSDTASNEIT